MGKSPGRWMKTFLFGKKSSRSKSSKAKDEKRGDDNEASPSLDQTANTNLSLSISQSSEGKIEENFESYNSQDEVRTPVPANQAIAIPAATTELNAQNDSDQIRQEKAATDVQTALRGYLARRAFRTLKGIIRLQALIRGHLVRRQAVSTLSCMYQIVKFQALARGRKIRHSVIGLEVQKGWTQITQTAMHSVRFNPSMQILKLSSNGFARKILASSPTAMPLHFQYDPNETNSVLTWLERWSTSHCWQLLPNPKPKLQKPPHTRRSSVTNVASIASEFDKPIRNLRKVTTTNEPTNLVEENPELVLERVKRNLRKVNNPILQTTFQTETETGKKSIHDNTQKVKTESSESEKTPEQPSTSEAKTVTTMETEKEDSMKKEKKKTRRRVSLPVNQEFMENQEPLQMKRSVPSYMAATESAKAKLRSPDPETPTLTRRHSLPNAKISVSPRAHKPIQTNSKFKNDRSLQLSRDGNVKASQAEWRR